MVASSSSTADKVVTAALEEAVAEHVRDGRCIYLGNFGAQLFSVGHEIIRQGLNDLDLVLASGGILMDQLLGAGALRSAVFAHCWSPVGPSPTHNFRRLVESGNPGVIFHELSLGLLTAALTAGAWGVPFMPVPDLGGTGYIDQDWSGGMISRTECALGRTSVVRAVVPDIAFLHVDLADEYGNGVVRGPLGELKEAAQASRRVVLVAEELASSTEVSSEGVTIPGVLVSSVVRLPGSVAPDGAVGRYDRDVASYRAYADRSATKEGFEQWLREEVL